MIPYMCRKGNCIKILRFYSKTCIPDFDKEYYCNRDNEIEIKNNINIRKGAGNIQKILQLYENFKTIEDHDTNYYRLQEELSSEISMLPNKTHLLVQDYKSDPRVIHTINTKRDYGSHIPLEFSVITEKLNLMRTSKLGDACGNRSYCYLGDLAELEEALIQYTVSVLLKKKFKLVSVPDILPGEVLEGCGTLNKSRTQVYSLDPTHYGPDLHLSGTAEMSLAALVMNSCHNLQNLPLKLTAVSRCHRFEISGTVEMRGTYRVHQFTKVEMFTVTTPEHSEKMLEELRGIQEELFTPLGLHMRVLDMPPSDLGAPAYRKYDIEAWMPGRKMYGEISSCSNCTDYQSRRLNIKCKDNSQSYYAHTLNATACAIPRMLIALLETHQDPKGKIVIPKILQQYMNGKEYIFKNKSTPELKLLKVVK